MNLLQGQVLERLIIRELQVQRALMTGIRISDADIDEAVATVEKLIAKHFAGIPAAEKPRPRDSYPVPGHAETLFSIESDPEVSGSSAGSSRSAVTFPTPHSASTGRGWRKLSSVP